MDTETRTEPSAFGRRIRDLRTERGWTQAELSQRAHVPRLSVSQWETGARQGVSVRNLCKLARAFDLTADALLPSPSE